MGIANRHRVEVETSPDQWHPGTEQYRTDDGAIAVQLDGEQRVDLWHAERVRTVAA